MHSGNLIHQALISQPSSANASLAQAMFMASLFFESSSNAHAGEQIQGYGPGNLKNNLILPSSLILPVSNAVSGLPGEILLILGPYTFKLKNNAIVAWQSGRLGAAPLSTPVALPSTWLNRFAAALRPNGE